MGTLKTLAAYINWSLLLMTWWICCSLVFGLMAQQSAPERTSSVALEGSVIHGISQEPIRKAHVTLELSGANNDSALVATTDGAGHFRFADIKPGIYKLTAEKPGFLESEHGQTEPEGEGSLLQVGNGDPALRLTLRLFPAGVISGRILDTDGDPVPDNQVVLWQRRHLLHKTANSHISQTTTNQAGEYHFNGLSPGSYYLSADGSGGWGNATRQISVDETGKVTKVHDLTTFYPAALSLAEAQAIQLESGQEQAGINVHIQQGRALKVQGRIVGISGSLSGYSLGASIGVGIGWTSEMAKVLPNGKFMFEELPPGKHTLHLIKQGGNGAQTIGQTEINLTDQDVTGVIITPFKPAQIRVRVVQEGDEEHSLTAGSVFLMPTDAGEERAKNQLQYQSHDGFYFFSNVIPGQYNVWFNNASGCYLKSILAGGQKLTTNKVVVAEGSNLVLLFIFLFKLAGIQGLVEMLQDGAKHSVHVVLVSESPILELNNTYPITLDQFFHFAKQSVTPGQYVAFATEDDTDLWDNAEFVKLLQSQGSHVELQEKQQGTLHLKLISKEETDRVRHQLGL